MPSFRLLPFFLLSSATLLRAQTPPPPADPDASPVVKLEKFVVSDRLDRAREDIVPALGASSYQLTAVQIAALPQGADAAFNQVLLRIPGVAQDSFGQVHLRGEHANLQYRINDVLLPEGISGFGQELDSRFVSTMQVLTGSLPAQYGYRTSGVVDIHTKGGAIGRSTAFSLYGGAHGTVRPSLETGGASGDATYYLSASYDANDLGIENPTASREALHDRTGQFKGFGYFSLLLDATSRLNLIVSGSAAHFQIPNHPGQPPAFALHGAGPADSATLDENQRENTTYAVAAWQKSAGGLNVQAAAFVRTSGVHFTPDPAGDLRFNGVASDVNRRVTSAGFEADGRWSASAGHTLRGGAIVTADRAATKTATAVFAADASGGQTTDVPFTVAGDQRKRALTGGVYLQDEWKVTDRLTINYGARADRVDAYTREGQLSPRVNAVYQIGESTNLHAGYARYFTPPPLELVQTGDIARFAGTTNATASPVSSPVRAERADYFDAGATHQVSPALSLGIDSYLKAGRNLLDEGQFGQALIFSPFNYRTGRVYGVELTANYSAGGFNAYANLAFSRAVGRTIASGEFQFDPAELAYLATHDVHLDHDQAITASAGASYTWRHNLLYADLLHGSGLRRDFANTGKLPAYHPLNLGFEHTFALEHRRKLRARVEIVNAFDEVYALRDGSGIGVGAPQFGARRSLYGGLSWTF
jgi:outer membrane receptor protein involved in Fe transport